VDIARAGIPGMWDKGGEKTKGGSRADEEELCRLDEIPALAEVARLEQKLLPLVDGILSRMI